MASSMTGQAWDAFMELVVGQTIQQQMAAFPPPPDARFAADFQNWGERLLEAGQRGLGECAPWERLGLVHEEVA